MKAHPEMANQEGGRPGGIDEGTVHHYLREVKEGTGRAAHGATDPNEPANNIERVKILERLKSDGVAAERTGQPGAFEFRVPASEPIVIEPSIPRGLRPFRGLAAPRVATGLALAPVVIHVVDDFAHGEILKGIEQGGGAGALIYGADRLATNGLKIGGRTLLRSGSKVIPVAGEVIGAGFAAIDMFDSSKTSGFRTASGIETALYSTAAVTGTFAAVDFWNPAGWGAGIISGAAGLAGLGVTGFKAVYYDTDWTGHHDSNKAPPEIQKKLDQMKAYADGDEKKDPEKARKLNAQAKADHFESDGSGEFGNLHRAQWAARHGL